VQQCFVCFDLILQFFDFIAFEIVVVYYNLWFENIAQGCCEYYDCTKKNNRKCQCYFFYCCLCHRFKISK